MGVEPALDISAEQRETILTLLNRHLPGTAAWVYGSRAKWTSRPHSDLDLVVFSAPDQRVRVAALRDAFGESDLPFRVDLFVWDDIPESFREQIERSHVVLSTEYKSVVKWAQHPLSDLADVRLSSVDKKVMPGERSVRLCNYTDVYYNNFIHSNIAFMEATASEREIEKCTLNFGDVVITKDSEKHDDIGVPALVREEIDNLVCGYHLAILRPQERAYGPYLYYALSTRDAQQQFHSYANGITRFGLRKADVGLVELPTPALHEQRAIAHILGTLDDKIELNRRMNETLEAMARALFKSWFVDFDPVRAKMEGRDPGLPQPLADLFPDRLVASEIGEIPEGWRVRPLGEQVAVSKGLSYKGAGLTKSGCGMPLHNLNSIEEGGGYKPSGLKYYSGEYKQRHVVRPGNLIVTNTEQGFDHLLIGYSAIVPEWSGVEALFSHHIFLIKVLPESPLSEPWLHYAISASWIGEAIRRFSNGTTVNMLPADAFRLADTIVPPQEVVDAFSKISGPMLKQQEHAVVRSRNLTALRDKLLPRLISGDIRLPETEKLEEAVS